MLQKNKLHRAARAQSRAELDRIWIVRYAARLRRRLDHSWTKYYRTFLPLHQRKPA